MADDLDLEMADDLSLVILSPKERPMAQQPFWPTSEWDYGKISKHLHRRHQVEYLEPHYDIVGWILSESIRRFNDALEETQGEPKTDGISSHGRFSIDLKVGILAIVLLCSSSSWLSDEVPSKRRYSSHVQDEDNIYQAICEPDQFDPSTSELTAEQPRDGNQQLESQCAPANSGPIYDQDIESLLQQTPGHSRNAHRVTVCHALIGTSIVGVATSLSLALWWSFAHGDPGSGFTIGSYVLAAFGVLVAIPGYPHSKVCRCWESRPKGT